MADQTHCATCGLSYHNIDHIKDSGKFTIGRSFHVILDTNRSLTEMILGTFLRERTWQSWIDLETCCRGHLDLVLPQREEILERLKTFNASCSTLQSMTGLFSGSAHPSPAEEAEQSAHNDDTIRSAWFIEAFKGLTETNVKPAKRD